MAVAAQACWTVATQARAGIGAWVAVQESGAARDGVGDAREMVKAAESARGTVHRVAGAPRAASAAAAAAAAARPPSAVRCPVSLSPHLHAPLASPTPTQYRSYLVEGSSVSQRCRESVGQRASKRARPPTMPSLLALLTGKAGRQRGAGGSGEDEAAPAAADGGAARSPVEEDASPADPQTPAVLLGGRVVAVEGSLQLIQLSVEPPVFMAEGLIDAATCDALIEAAQPLLSRARCGKGSGVVSASRTCSNCWLGSGSTAVRRLEARVAQLVEVRCCGGGGEEGCTSDPSPSSPQRPPQPPPNHPPATASAAPSSRRWRARCRAAARCCWGRACRCCATTRARCSQGERAGTGVGRHARQRLRPLPLHRPASPLLAPRQYHGPHLDPWSEPGDLSRAATVNVFLNDAGLAGGATSFLAAAPMPPHRRGKGVKVPPARGRAVLFWSRLPSGEVDPLSRHEGEAVERGVKYAATCWLEEQA